MIVLVFTVKIDMLTIKGVLVCKSGVDLKLNANSLENQL